MDIQNLCNGIVLVSAVIIAIKNIYGFFKKPVDSIQGRARANEESHIKEVVTATIDELKSFMVQALNDRFNELQQMNQKQNEKIDIISDTLDKVLDSSKDVLRIRMNEIYYKYLPYRTICDSDKQLFDSLYKDYAQLRGNSAWGKINETVQSWTIVDDNYKFEQDV